jgi:hypothetical protein
MSDQKRVDVEPQQVTVFLDKIARDRDRELQDIETQKQDRIAQLRHEAFAESRRIHHKATEQARATQSQKHDRYLATVNAKLRRRHWRVLTDLQQRVVDAVWERMMQSWNKPGSQWRWCRVWLTEARSRSGSDPMQINLGRGACSDVCERIKVMMADYPGQFELQIDESAPEGIVICWADHMLDGALRMQHPELLESALRRITQIIYPEPEGR